MKSLRRVRTVAAAWTISVLVALVPAEVLILVLLIALEFVRAPFVTWPLLSVAAVLVASSALANFGPLRSGSQYLQDWSRYVRVELAALELAGRATDPAFRPDATRAPDITAGKYFEAARAAFK